MQDFYHCICFVPTLHFFFKVYKYTKICINKKLLIILAGYKGNDMKFVKSVITAPDSGSFTKMLENISIDKSEIDQIKAYCWDTETYKPMIPHKTI